MPELEQWKEWRKKCALKLCRSQTQHELTAFAHARFSTYIRRCIHMTNATNPAGLLPPAVEAWHRFETLVCIRNNRKGKACKEWLFERYGDDSFDAVQGGASLLIRDAVREMLRRETAPAIMRSLDTPLTNADGFAFSLMELLPDDADPAGEAAGNDECAIALRLAEKIARKLPRRARVAILAREQGFSITNPAVLQVAGGCGKSALAEAYNKALHTIAHAVKAEYHDEDRLVQAEIAVKTLHQLKYILFSDKYPESRQLRFFMRREGDKSNNENKQR